MRAAAVGRAAELSCCCCTIPDCCWGRWAFPKTAYAVVAVAVAVVVAVVLGAAGSSRHLQDLKMTEEISSKDETLSPQRRPLEGVAIWWSICCIAPLAWPVESLVDEGAPVKEKDKTLGQVSAIHTGPYFLRARVFPEFFF